jgi:hypothetical protein
MGLQLVSRTYHSGYCAEYGSLFAAADCQLVVYGGKAIKVKHIMITHTTIEP